MIFRMTPLALAGLATLGGINAWLLTEVAGDLVRHDQITEKVDWAPKLRATDEHTPAVRPISAYQLALAHPLFFKSRAPFVPKPVQPPPMPVPQLAPAVFVDPGLEVGGIMISGGVRKAYLFKKAERQGTWVREGEDFMGWKLKSVEAGTAKLQQNDRTLELPLYAAR